MTTARWSVFDEGGEILFDLQRDEPALYEALHRNVGILPELCARLRSGIPAVGSCSPHIREGSYRLRQHHRSQAIPVDPLSPPLLSASLAIKGSEPLFDEFPEYLAWMMTAPFRRSELSVGLHFPLVLRMPPGAFPLDEALREQSAAIHLQSSFLQRYSALAHVPTPLMIYRLSERKVAEYAGRLQQMLPPPAVARVASRVSGGLAVCVSYYPGSQIRVADAFDPHQGVSAAVQRLLVNPDTVVRRWIASFLQLLSVGLVPTATWNVGWGSCLDPGNACLDGGFCDLVTLTKVADIPSRHLLYASVTASAESMAQTAMALSKLLTRRHAAERDEALAQNVRSFVRHVMYEEMKTGMFPMADGIQQCLCPGTMKDLCSLDSVPQYSPSAFGEAWNQRTAVGEMA